MVKITCNLCYFFKENGISDKSITGIYHPGCFVMPHVESRKPNDPHCVFFAPKEGVVLPDPDIEEEKNSIPAKFIG